MSSFYELVGRIVVAVVRVRFGRELRVLALLGAAAAVAIGFALAHREAEEA